MTPAVTAMLALLRDPAELKRHIDDAAIAQQLPPIKRAEWLAKAERVRAARDQLTGKTQARHAASVGPPMVPTP